MRGFIVAMIFTPIVGLALIMTPLGLADLEAGWKFSYQNPAEIFFTCNDSISANLIAGFGKNELRKFRLSYFTSPKEGTLSGLVYLERYYVQNAADSYSLAYSLAGGDELTSWGLKIGLDYFTTGSSTHVAVKLGFGIDLLFGNIRAGGSIQDLYIWTDDPKFYMAAKYSATLGYFTDTLGFYLNGYTGNFALYGLGLGMAFSNDSFGVSLRGDYLYDFPKSTGTFQIGVGSLFTVSSMSFALTVSKSMEEMNIDYPYTCEGSDWSLGLSINIGL